MGERLACCNGLDYLIFLCDNFKLQQNVLLKEA